MPAIHTVPGATPSYDDDGNEIVKLATCGTCGRTWNDAAVSGVTPVPSGRCPFEYEHDKDDAEEATICVEFLGPKGWEISGGEARPDTMEERHIVMVAVERILSEGYDARITFERREG